MAGKKRDTDPATEEVKTEDKVKKAKSSESKADKAAQLEQQLAEKCDQILRLAAEYDNYRKRSQKEKSDIFTDSKASVVEKLLPMMDNFERALNTETDNVADYKKGIEMIYTQFVDILTALSVEPFCEPGDAFDPNFHNAVMHIEDDKLGENVVAAVLSKGYKIGDKVIRSATVTVAN